MLLSQGIAEFFKAQIGIVADTTRQWYEKRLAPLEPLHAVDIRAVSPEQLRDAWATVADRTQRHTHNQHRPPSVGGLSPYTLDGYYRCWRAFFNWCVEQEYIPKNPMKKLKRPRLPDAPPKAINESDLSKLLQAASANRRDYAVLCFMAGTGCRVGGLAGLRLCDLELDRGRAWVTEKGRGGGKRRAVYVAGATLTALCAYLAERPTVDHDYVFVAEVRRQYQPLSEDAVRQILKRLARAANVVGRFNPHSFRHRFAREGLSNGADLGTMSLLLGHSDIQVTASFYARWGDDELREKHARFTGLPKTDSVAMD